MRPLLLALLIVAAPAAAQTVTSAEHGFRVTVIAEALEHPWGMAFLPDGGILVTERPGRLRLVKGPGQVGPALTGTPTVFASGQGGLLDVVLHPDFGRNRFVYLSYAAASPDGQSTRVTRGRLTDQGLADVREIVEATPRGRGGLHFGSRMAFGLDGFLYVATGERYDRNRAQDLTDLRGKVLRLNDDGTAPSDNPFVGRAGIRPEIFSYGHRNPQGLTVHPTTGVIWEIEHGPRGGDELNRLKPGANYGWPLVTYGIDYSGAKIGDGASKPGIEEPAKYWVPSISPSGMTFYTGAAFPKWRGNLFTGGLNGQVLVRLVLDGEKVVREERLLEGAVGRIRDVRQGPDGRLYLLTDAAAGRLLRLDPA